MITLADLYWLVLAFLILVLWWRTALVREYATQHAKRYCHQHDLQWLDQNLVLTKRKLTRQARLVFQIERSYTFEFATTGRLRYQGVVTMHGNRLSGIVTDAYEEPDQPDSDSSEV